MKNKLPYQLLLLILTILTTFSLPAQKRKKSTATNQPKFEASQFHGLKWRNIGPFRGGRANAISGVIGDPMTYYAGYTGGGVWKTNDGGANWKNISDGYFTSGSIGDIAVSESDPNLVLVGSGEHAVRGVMTSFGDGVYLSKDAGETWSNIGLSKTRHISDVIIHPTNGDIMYVGAQGAVHGASPDRGVYKTSDGGKTWRRNEMRRER